MSNINYVMCENGDWCAVYKDGEMVYQGHSIPDWVWISLLDGREFYEDQGQFGEDLAEWGGQFPQHWSEVEEKL